MTQATGFILDREDGHVVLRAASSEEQVKASIRAVLLTRRGERALSPEFGSELYRYMFRPLSAGLLVEIQNEIRTSIERSEPRVEVTQVRVESEELRPETLGVSIGYVYRATGKAGQVKVGFHA